MVNTELSSIAVAEIAPFNTFTPKSSLTISNRIPDVKMYGKVLEIDANNFSYQSDEKILKQIKDFLDE